MRPVYPTDVEPHPAAQRLCDVLWRLPRDRRLQCCGGSPSGIRPETSCIATASAALAGGGVSIDEAALAECEGAARRALQTCDWVGNLSPQPPAECGTLFVSAVEAEQRCRSSLECPAGLRCRGAGPTDAGVCRPPGGEGAYCNTGVDALAAAGAQTLDAHPECAGWCRSNRCQPATPVGKPCTTNAECGSQAHCDGKACRAGRALRGGSCADGGCADGLRCVGGSCIEPAGAGATCSSDLECRGACLREDGADGRCGMRCQRRLSP